MCTSVKMKVTGRELVGCHCVHAGVGHLKVVRGILCPCLSLPDLWRHTVNHSLVDCSEAGQAGKAWDLNQNHLLCVWNPNSARRCSQSRQGLQYGSRDLGSLSSQLPRVKGWAVKVLPGKIVQTPVLGQCIIRHTPQGTEVELEQEQDLVTETKLQGGHLAAKEGVQVQPQWV